MMKNNYRNGEGSGAVPLQLIFFIFVDGNVHFGAFLYTVLTSEELIIT